MDTTHIVARFDRHAREAGATPAVVCGADVHTYAELQEWSLDLAAAMQRARIGPGDYVCLFGQRGAAFAAGALAAWRCGAAYVPVADDLPTERVAQILRQTGSRVVVELGATPLPAAHPCVFGAGAVTPHAGAVTPGEGEHHLAYVIFTSGSTGTPKGVMVGHETLGPMMHVFGAHFGLRPGDRVSAVANIGFDASVIEFWPALGCGATVHVAAPETLGSVHVLLDWLAASQISFSWLPTPLVEVMIGSPDLAPPACLRVIETAGQRLTARPAHWQVPLENSYGPTEATVIATSGSVAPHGEQAPDIGRPLAGVAIRLLGQDGKPVAAGAVGQIHIGGIGVARGYLNQPELTAQRFVTDPQDPGRRLYATGDLGRWNAQGALEFHGRLDDQVKVRGFRIEPGEIEFALHAIAGVSQAACVAEGPAGAERLHAFVRLAAPRKDIAADWRAQLAARLPRYMLPDVLTVLETMPLTANGKVDRRALGAMSAADHANDAPDAPAQAFLRLVRTSLRLPALCWRQDLFAGGASSVDILVLLEALRRERGRILSVRALHQARTPQALYVLGQSGTASSATRLLPVPAPSTLPLSCQQRAVWLASGQDSTGLAYQARLRIELGAGIDRVALAAALGDMVARHAILRTRFPAADGAPVQCIEAPYAVELPELDLRACPAAGLDDALEAAFDGPLGAPFQLNRLPLARWTLVRLPDGQATLLHVEHHILHDGWSHQTWLDELMIHHAHRRNGSPAPFAPAAQYADYQAAQQRWLDAEEGARSRDYWRGALAGAAQAARLSRNGAAHDPHGSVLRRTLAPARWAALEAYCRAESSSPFVLLQSVLAATLARYAAADDVCIGTAFVNRRWEGTAGMLGMTANTVVLRTRFEPDDTVRSVLARARERYLDAQDHECYPLERIVQDLGVPNTDGQHSLFQVFFGLHQPPALSGAADGVRSPRVAPPLSTGAAKFDLALLVHPPAAGHAGPVSLLWEFRHASFAAWFVQAFADCFDALLSQFLRAPAGRVADFRCPPPPAPAATWPAPAGAGQPPYARIAAAALRTPQARAIACGAVALDYRTLVAAVAQRCAQLRAGGVGPGHRVALRLPRSADAIVWMLAVQQAGAAYIPLDPDYPEERLAYIVAHAGARCLVDQAGLAVLPADGAPGAADAAYVIYTSGSTGKPKGVVVDHGNLAFFLSAMAGRFPLQPGDRWAAVTSFSFDISILECLLPLTLGATVVLVDGACARDAGRLAALLEAEAITHLQATPTTWRALLETCWQPASGFVGLCGGEALDAALAGRWLQRGLRLHNMYGPTETTIWSCMHQVQHADGPIPIGSPIGATEIHVLDRHGRPVPHGAIGELLIGGPGVSQGYLHAPELTAERFLAHPFGGSGKLYRTGDLVAHGAAGELLFHGRNDHQLKVRGFRVEAEEVERTIAACAGIDGVLVTVCSLPGGDALTAYVTAAASVVDLALLTTHCATRLPPYMVPRHWVQLARFPLTPNGKIDRLALPLPETAAPGRAPNGATEAALVDLYRPLFGGATVSVTAGFYMQGGESALAMRLVALINRHFGTALTVATFLGLGTIAALAVWIEQNTRPEIAEEFAL